MKITFKAIILSLLLLTSYSQSGLCQVVPSSYSNIVNTDSGMVFIGSKGEVYTQVVRGSGYSLAQMVNAPMGTAKGMSFDFKDTTMRGSLYYGFINIRDEAYPLPVYFKTVMPIRAGKCEVDLLALGGKYDMVKWEKSNRGLLAYRVVDRAGQLLYDGRVAFKYDGEFEIQPTIIEGPSIHKIGPNEVTLRIVLNKPSKVSLWINKQIISSDEAITHEIKVTGLLPSTKYSYEFEGFESRIFSLTTAPEKGSKSPFIFSYASDSRNGNGGGERNLYGANAYIMNRIMALNKLKGVQFMQFSGDLINGYLTSNAETDLQYANWKRSLEPFSQYIPTYVAIGNHEALLHVFRNGTSMVSVDKFPFAKESAEAAFQNNFCNPTSELSSEDGSKYDPNPNELDFPSYEETVYSYNYGNVEVVVLNSNYWYAPMAHNDPTSSGNIHAYIMDNQLKWLRKKIVQLENDKSIQHVFVTQHTPFFPNGGHVQDDMWYNGNNDPRPYIAGKPVEKGIIERRDELLDLLVNQSTKVRAILTGDEHNYAKTLIGAGTAKYPLQYAQNKIELKRSIWQINNGSAGAPYYAQEETPWTPFVSNFSTQNVLVLFHVAGSKVKIEVVNPLTFETVDELEF